MIYINDKEVNFIYNLGEKVKEVFSYGTKIWPKEVLFDYMYFKLADGYTSGNVSYKFDEYYNLHNKYLKISTDGNNWSDWTESISMSPNVKYYVKGEDDYVRNSDISGGFFSSDVSKNTFNIECGGDVMSLCNLATEINTNYCFKTLFQYMHNLVTPPKLPATTLSDYCYFGMFFDCTSLTQAPELPATIMKPSCYLSMFMGCKSLTVAPELQSTTLANSCYQNLLRGTSITNAPVLPATTLANGCYTGMFYGCSSLTQAPELPATTLAKECYRTMFNSCSSLTQAPELPATTLADYCYSYMFQGCSSLTQAHELPATTLSYCCYTGMFNGCSSLVHAPALPATTLAKECYRTMFNSCSSLTQAPELPATTLADYCYSNMFNNCTSLTQAPELPATTLANNCYNSMFLNSNKLNWIKALFTTTPSTSYTKSWVNGVSTQGVFVKNIDATWTDTGVNAVPTGWTVIYYDQTEGKYYTTQTKEVECDQYGNVKADYMYFKLADGEKSGNVSYKFDEYYNLHNKYLKYRTDGSNWSDWTEQISMTPNTKYFVKGEDSYVRNSKIDGGFFTSDVSQNAFNIECGGNVMSLCNMATEITTNYCFRTLFQQMTNLVTPPKFPATTLSDYCYQNMFQGCTSLTEAPELPATTLADYCYNAMFQSCKSLTQAPELPATTLANYCYSNMFNGCSSLTEAPELPTRQIVVSGCYHYMLYKSNKLNWIKALFINTPGSTLTKNWVNGVSSQGVFVKNIDATWTDTGVNAVPTGWTVIYFDQTEGKYYTTKTKEVECDKYGNVKQEIDAMYFKLADGYTSGNVSYKFDEYYNLHNKYLKYSTDGSNWSDWTEQISMTPNTKYFVKGEDSYVRNSDISGGFFTSDVSTQNFNIECGGNVMSLCNMNENITTNNCFCSLFYNMKNLLTPPALPATTLSDYCYNGMFNGCFKLVQAPELPATTLAIGCYYFMFFGCYSLTKSPELPATTLANYCYAAMFYNSNKLNWIKALFTNKPSDLSTTTWVNGVSSQGVFVQNIDATWMTTGTDSIPTGWKVIYFDTTNGRYYTTQTKEVECDKYGNPL